MIGNPIRTGDLLYRNNRVEDRVRVRVRGENSEYE
jgi:hypothetical protein